MNIITDYSKCKINGLNYVREIKDKEGKRSGYLLIDNYNKPIKDIYNYLRYMKNMKGCALNSLKRFVYDIAYFYDFMLINNLPIELIDSNILCCFVSKYLRQIDPSYRVNDSIERSMLKKVPILPEYEKENVKVLNEKKTAGLSDDSIVRIVNYLKELLVFLVDQKKYDIYLNSLFGTSRIYKHKRWTSNYINYSINGILKACNIKVRGGHKKIRPINAECVFSKKEKELFFNVVYNNSTPMYQLLFYLLSVTGMRIAEALALKLYSIDKNMKKYEFRTMNSDIILENDEEDLWRVYIKTYGNRQYRAIYPI